MNAIVERTKQSEPALPAPITPMDMLARVVESGQSIETIGRMMDFAERWEKNQARKAFDQAIADAKAEIEPAIRNRTGHNSKKYADFAAIAEAVKDPLARHGLSYRFRTVQADRISVTCVLSHRDGHAEECTLSGPPDETGSKNKIQAIGSTLTYLQRYSLVQALGLAVADDDDGKDAGSGDVITHAQELKLDTLIEDVGADKAKFLTFLKIKSLDDLPASRFEAAVRALEAKRKP